MKKYLLSLAVGLLIGGSGCITVVDEHSQPAFMGHKVTAEELVAYIGSGSLYLPVYNDLAEADVLSLDNNIITVVDESGKLVAIDNKDIVYRTAWRDGTWILHLSPRKNWRVRYNLAVMNGKIIGTVGEVHHGQD